MVSEPIHMVSAIWYQALSAAALREHGFGSDDALEAEGLGGVLAPDDLELPAREGSGRIGGGARWPPTILSCRRGNGQAGWGGRRAGPRRSRAAGEGRVRQDGGGRRAGPRRS